MPTGLSIHRHTRAMFELIQRPLTLVTRAGLIASVLALSALAYGEPLAACVLLGIWGVELGKFIGSDGRTYGREHETLLLLSLMVQTMWVQVHSGDTRYATLWIIPAALSFIMIVLGNASTPLAASKYMSVSAQAADTLVRYDRRGMAVVAVLVCAGAAGEAMVYGFILDTSRDGLLVLLTLTQGIASLSIVTYLHNTYKERAGTDNVWMGGSALPLQWAVVQLAPIVLLSGTLVSMRIVIVVSTLLVVQASLRYFSGEDPVLRPRREIESRWCVRMPSAVWEIVLSVFMLSKAVVLAMDMILQLAVLAGVATFAAVFTSPVYTTHMDFPPAARALGDAFLTLQTVVIAPMMEFLDNKDVFKLLYPILPDIAALHSFVITTSLPVYRALETAANGITVEVVPFADAVTCILFLLGPVTAALAVLCQLFDRGSGWVRSYWFWAYQVTVTMALLVCIHACQDLRITVLHSFMGGLEYQRVYTSDGIVGVVALGLVVAASTLLALRQLFIDALAQGAVERGVKQTRGAGKVTSRCRQCLLAPFRLLLNPLRGFSASSFIVLCLAIFVLVVATSKGMPYKVSVQKAEDTRPHHLRSILYMQVGVVVQELVKMLNPKTRIAFVYLTLTEIALRLIKCESCFCAPNFPGYFNKAGEYVKVGLDSTESALDSFGSSLSSAFHFRRLLEAQEATNSTADMHRRLLGVEDCQPLSCKTGLTSFCAVDMIDDLPGLLYKLFMTIMDQLGPAFKEALNLVPGISILVDKISILPNLDLYRNFKLVPDVQIPSLGDILDIPFLQFVRFPTLPAAAGTLIFLVVCTLLILTALDMGRPSFAVTLGLLQIAVLTGVACAIVFACLGVEVSKALLLSFGFQLVFTMADHFLLFVTAAGLFVLSLMLSVSETGLDVVSATVYKAATSGKPSRRAMLRLAVS